MMLARPNLMAACLLVAATGWADTVARYRSNDSNLNIEYREALVDQRQDGSFRLRLKGGVIATSASQGIKIVAQDLDLVGGNAATKAAKEAAGKAKKRTEIRSFLAKGSPVLTKTSSVKGARSFTEATGSEIDYAAKGTQGTAILKGPVTLLFRTTLDARDLKVNGSQATLGLFVSEEGKTSLLLAKVAGPVRVQAFQTGSGGKTKVVATGKFLDVFAEGEGYRIVLRQDVKVASETLSPETGRGTGSFEGLGQATLWVNKLGDVTRVSTSVSGGKA